MHLARRLDPPIWSAEPPPAVAATLGGARGSALAQHSGRMSKSSFGQVIETTLLSSRGEIDPRAIDRLLQRAAALVSSVGPRGIAGAISTALELAGLFETLKRPEATAQASRLALALVVLATRATTSTDGFDRVQQRSRL